MNLFSVSVLVCLFFIRSALSFEFTISAQCSCSFKIDPVCGSSENGQSTFMNQCLFECSKKRNRSLIKLYDGPCCQTSVCTTFDNPVCDSRGDLHSNHCSYEKQKCLANRVEGVNLGIDMSAPNCACVKHCTALFQPVCDNFGRTHANMCTFSNAKCVAKAKNEKIPELEHLGRCCGDLCTPGRRTFPVCDSLGNTHSDFCAFLVFRCEVVRLQSSDMHAQFKSLGPCANGDYYTKR